MRVSFKHKITLNRIMISLWEEFRMNGKTKKTYTGKCVDCGMSLELYEIDFKKRQRIMQCTRCGLYHFYKKSFFGKWKLVKACRVSDLWRKSK